MRTESIDWNNLTDADFRRQVRDFFEQNYPAQLRYPERRLRWAEIRDWTFKLIEKGWIAPNWPRKHGGMELTPAKLLIFYEEQERWGVARAPDQGIVNIGPLLIQFGSDDQKERYLPKIITYEHIWCQGYSEPNAGSDLASLRTEARCVDGQFVITGQKIWTTLAHEATHMYLLARTNKETKKQKGISFFLLDLKTPGVTIRPIRNLVGHEEFCEVFLDGVIVPAENLVGALEQGWTISKALMGHERIHLGTPKLPQLVLQRIAALSRARGLLGDPVFMDRLTRLRLNVADQASLYTRFADAVRRGEVLGPEISALKIWATETHQELTEVLMDMAGPDGVAETPIQTDEMRIDALGTFLTARKVSIYGGSNEIQRNILARNVLNLPRG